MKSARGASLPIASPESNHAAVGHGDRPAPCSEKKRCQEPFFCFFGRPWRRRVLSSPSRRTIRSHDASSPKGHRRFTLRRRAVNSASLCGASRETVPVEKRFLTPFLPCAIRRPQPRGHCVLSGMATARFSVVPPSSLSAIISLPSSLILVGPLPWPSQPVPSMAPRGIIAAPSMAPFGVFFFHPNWYPRGRSSSGRVPPIVTANRFRRDRQPGIAPNPDCRGDQLRCEEFGADAHAIVTSTRASARGHRQQRPSHPARA